MLGGGGELRAPQNLSVSNGSSMWAAAPLPCVVLEQLVTEASLLQRLACGPSQMAYHACCLDDRGQDPYCWQQRWFTCQGEGSVEGVGSGLAADCRHMHLAQHADPNWGMWICSYLLLV